MRRISERRDVQETLINILRGIGWQFIPRGDFRTARWRGEDETNPFLSGILKGQLATLNNWNEDDPRIDEVIRKLGLLPANLEGHEHVVQWLRGQQTAYDQEQQREFNVALVDYDDPDNNRYHFTEEMWFSGRDRRRMDLVLFVNGLPVVLVENKNPKIRDPGLEGFKQVQNTYTGNIPEFLKYPVPFAVPATRLEYGATWNPDLKAFYRWKTVDDRDAGLEILGRSFFDRRMILSFIRDFTIFYHSDDSMQKYLLRPHQIRTVNRIVKRVLAGLDDLEAADTGLVWHTQGSGKTLTMIVAAHLLRRQSELKNPILLIVVDRIELESQMVQNLKAYGWHSVHNPDSKRELCDLLKNGTNGLIVTTIHKFDDMPANMITDREVVILIDEAHRSQEGELGIFLNAALPNAFRFGFTGTPIDDRGKVGRGTFEMFGQYDRPHGYHDKYSINESIADKTTVPLYYTLAPSEVLVDRQELDEGYKTLLEEFFEEMDEVGVASIEELNRQLQKADKLLAVLKSPERVDANARHIANHFREYVLPLGFKALVVTPDREACALYKAALDRMLPPEWSRVVYSGNTKDGELLRQHYLGEDEERLVRKAFRDPNETPKILIVTEKLLTGYDAPVAYAMYLDKPLRDHTLLQAIARVNRPYENKENGLIVDYIGIFENLQRALSFDTENLSLGLIDLKQLKEQFSELKETAKQQLAPVNLDRMDGRTDRLIDYFLNEELREAFVQTFKKMRDAYEILSPDAFLRPHLNDYLTIVDVYGTLISHFDPQIREGRLLRALGAKTETLISEHVETSGPMEPLPLYPINENIADLIREDNNSDRVKVLNLYRGLVTHIENNQQENPYLLSISDEVVRIIEGLQDRQISTETALEQLELKAFQVDVLEKERKDSSLDNLAFSLRMVVRANDLADDADGLATQLAGYLHDKSGWRFNDRLRQTVRRHLQKLIFPILPRTPERAQKSTAIVDELLRMHERDS